MSLEQALALLATRLIAGEASASSGAAVVRVSFALLVGLVGMLLVAACAGGEGIRRDDPKLRSGPHEAPSGRAADIAVDAVGVPLRAPGFDAARTMTVHLLDVGQGAATLLEFPCGAVLIDTGGESNESFHVEAELRRQLDAFFDRRSDLQRTLDLLIITHPHIDHLRGLPTLLETVTVRNIVDNGDGGDELVAREMKVLARYLEEKKPGHRSVRLHDIVKRNGLTDDVIDPVACEAVDPKLRVLWGGLDSDPGWGTDNYGKPRFANQNNHSVVTRVDFGATSLLVTGDLEDIAIHALLEKYEGTRWLDVDIYQAGHHGSANGTTRPLVEALTPSLALIAMGDPDRHHQWTAWAYGHPRAGVVDVLHDGVGLERPPVEVLVGKGTKRFTSRMIHRAIFGTGWDGAVAVDVSLDGEIAVRRRLKRR